DSAAAPSTPRIVSCWPAKLASGRSSAVALERTATRPPPIASYAAVRSASGTTPDRYASVVRQNPAGTRSPARTSSARPAALPPTSSSRPGSISLRSRSAVTVIAQPPRRLREHFHRLQHELALVLAEIAPQLQLGLGLGFLKPLQQLDAGPGQTNQSGAPVTGVLVALHQVAAYQLVDQPAGVG